MNHYSVTLQGGFTARVWARSKGAAYQLALAEYRKRSASQRTPLSTSITVLRPENRPEWMDRPFARRRAV